MGLGAPLPDPTVAAAPLPAVTSATDGISVTLNPDSTATNPLDHISINDSSASVAKAPTPAKSRKPILSPNDTFATVGEFGGTTNHKIAAEGLGRVRKRLKALAELSEKRHLKPEENLEFAQKQLEITETENRLRKGKVTGGAYREHALALLDAEAIVNPDKLNNQKAAHYRVRLANQKIEKLRAAINQGRSAIQNETETGKKAPLIKKLYAGHASIAAQEAEKAKGYRDFANTLTDYTSSEKKWLLDEAKKRDEYIDLYKAGEKTDEKLAADLVAKRGTFAKAPPSFSPALRDMETAFTDPHAKAATAVTAAKEPSPYENWLCMRAEDKYNFDNGKEGGGKEII